MPRFLAAYTMKPEDLARFRAMPKQEQDAVDAIGLKRWAEWEERNAASIPDGGDMVGKTLRVTQDGVAPSQNTFCGYIVVEAETIEDAARLFEGHPHFSVFPGDGVDIMPFLTGIRGLWAKAEAPAPVPDGACSFRFSAGLRRSGLWRRN